MLEISDIILTSILKGLKRKPTLLVHFLFATILATILKILVKLIVNYFVNYFHISLSNYQVVLSEIILTCDINVDRVRAIYTFMEQYKELSIRKPLQEVT